MANSYTIRVEKKILSLIEELKRQNSDRLPTEAELIEELKIGRHTLRKAIDRYVTEGMLEKVQGKGTFIVRREKELNFSGWIGTEPPGDVFIQQMISSFDSINPDLKLRYTPIPYYQTVEQLIRLALTGKMPDVAQLVPHFIAILNDFEVLLPLDGYINHNDLRKRYPIDVESGQVEKRIISLSWALSPFILYCNRNVLKKSGIDPETVPVTLDELLQICERVNSCGNPNTWGICLPLASKDPTFLWLYPYFLSFKGGFSDTLGNITIASEENANALKWISALYRKGAVPGIKSVVDGRMLFTSDRIAFWIDGPWMKGLFRQLSSFREEFASHYRIVKIPAGPSGKSESVLFSHHLAISRQCRDIVSACRWIEFLTTNEDIIKYYFKSSGCLPPMRDALNKPFFKDDPFAAVCIDQMETVSAFPLNQRLFTRSLSFVSQGIQKIIAESWNPEDALEQLKNIIHMISQSAFLGIYSH